MSQIDADTPRDPLAGLPDDLLVAIRDLDDEASDRLLRQFARRTRNVRLAGDRAPMKRAEFKARFLSPEH